MNNSFTLQQVQLSTILKTKCEDFLFYVPEVLFVQWTNIKSFDLKMDFRRPYS